MPYRNSRKCRLNGTLSNVFPVLVFRKTSSQEENLGEVYIVYVAILAFWIVSVVGVPASTAMREYVHYIGTALCLAITIVAYSKMFFRLRHNQIHRIHPLQGESQAIQMNIARYKKAVYSALWVQAALVVCYLPLIIATALIHQRGMHLSYYLAWQFTSTLVYINSSLNPFIYCWKIREVKLAVKETLRRLVRRWSG